MNYASAQIDDDESLHCVMVSKQIDELCVHQLNIWKLEKNIYLFIYLFMLVIGTFNRTQQSERNCANLNVRWGE
jgi:hypothetical protein